MSDALLESSSENVPRLFSILGRDVTRPPLTTRTAAILADVARADGRISDAIRLIEIATMLAERDFWQQERLRAGLATFSEI